MPKFVFFEYLHFTWNSHFGIQNVKLGKIWPRRFNGLKKTKLEPKFEVSISKNKETGQQCSYQKIWKILLLISELLNWLFDLMNWLEIHNFTWQSKVDPHLPVLLIRTQFPSNLSIFSAILWRVSWLTISIFLDLKNCAIKANGNFPKP